MSEAVPCETIVRAITEHHDMDNSVGGWYAYYDLFMFIDNVAEEELFLYGRPPTEQESKEPWRFKGLYDYAED